MSTRARTALVAAGFGVVLLVLTWGVTRHVGWFEYHDRSILVGFVDLHYQRLVPRLAYHIAELCNPNPYVYLAAVPLLIALVRGRVRVMVGIAVILIGANLTTQFVKPALPAMPREILPGGVVMGGPTWPSGHATAAMSLALCCVLASPARLRPAVAMLGAAFAVGVSYSFLVLAWHFPSDVLGGYLVAVVWTLIAVAGIYEADMRWPRRTREPAQPLSLVEAVAPSVALLLGVLLVASFVLLVRPQAV